VGGIAVQSITATAPITTSDSGKGAESRSLTATTVRSDAGSGRDITSSRQFYSSDSQKFADSTSSIVKQSFTTSAITKTSLGGILAQGIGITQPQNLTTVPITLSVSGGMSNQSVSIQSPLPNPITSVITPSVSGGISIQPILLTTKGGSVPIFYSLSPAIIEQDIIIEGVPSFGSIAKWIAQALILLMMFFIMMMLMRMSPSEEEEKEKAKIKPSKEITTKETKTKEVKTGEQGSHKEKA
jgi:hypothetical protein